MGSCYVRHYYKFDKNMVKTETALNVPLFPEKLKMVSTVIQTLQYITLKNSETLAITYMGLILHCQNAFNFYYWKSGENLTGSQSVLANAVQGGDRSNIRSSQSRVLVRSWPVNRSWLGAVDWWQNLAGHIVYKIFDRLPVPIKNISKTPGLHIQVTKQL